MEDQKDAPKKSFAAADTKKRSVRETWMGDLIAEPDLADEIMPVVTKFVTNVIGSYFQVLTLKLAWNRVATKVFDVERITFWEAAGLVAIAEMLTFNLYEEARKTRKAAEAAE